MKLNFWQWLGVVLLVLGGSYWYYGHYVRKPDDTPTIIPDPTLQPGPASRPAA